MKSLWTKHYRWPTSLGAIHLEVRDSDGETRLAPLVSVSNWRIDFQVSGDASPGEAGLLVGGIQVGRMQVEPLAPGLFMASPENETPSALGAMVKPGLTQVPVPMFSCTGRECRAEPIPLSSAGDRPMYLSFYGTGFRGANTDNVTCSVIGVPQPVDCAGPQSATPGPDPINVRLLP